MTVKPLTWSPERRDDATCSALLDERPSTRRLFPNLVSNACGNDFQRDPLARLQLYGRLAIDELGMRGFGLPLGIKRNGITWCDFQCGYGLAIDDGR